MANDEMAGSYLATSAYTLRQARVSVADGVWNIAVRRAQESVELSLKAALRLAGVDVPKVHDVGTVMRENAPRFPQWWNDRMDSLARISRQLRHDREISIYGDEETGLPPERIFTREDAEEAVKDAETVLGMCQRLQSEHSSLS